MRHAAYVVTTVEGARADVQELAPRKVTLIKTWVDDRGGDDQDADAGALRRHHRRGAQAQHARRRPRDRPARRKDLLRAGIDVFAHMISDVDDELVALFKQHPKHGRAAALGGPRRIVYAPWLNPPHPLIAETVRPEQIKRLQDRLAPQTPADDRGGTQRPGTVWRSGLRRLQAAGVKIGVGTDGGGQTGRSVRRLDDARRAGEHGRWRA